MQAGNTGDCIAGREIIEKEKSYTEGNGSRKREEMTGRSCNKNTRKRGKQRTRREVPDERLQF